MDISLLTTILKGIIVPLIAIFVVNRWNFFEVFSFIPEEYLFEFGLTSYILLEDCVFHVIKNKMKDNEAQIECLFYCNNQKKSINTIPNIEFQEDVAYIRGSIKVCGKGKKLCKNSIVLTFPNWVDVQIYGQDGLLTVNDNICSINISAIVNRREAYIEEATVGFKIGVIKNYSEDRAYTAVISPTLNNKWGYEFIHNKIDLRGE